jgi:hypothetical protein
MSDASTITEADILKDIIVPDHGDLARDVAKSLLQWRFTDRATARMGDLADRNNKGTISDTEREELDKYLRVGSLINLVQAKARLSLKQPQPPS